MWPFKKKEKKEEETKKTSKNPATIVDMKDPTEDFT